MFALCINIKYMVVIQDDEFVQLAIVPIEMPSYVFLFDE